MSPAARRDRQTAEAARSGPDPVTLIVGDEELLVERAVSAVLASAAACRRRTRPAGLARLASRPVLARSAAWMSMTWPPLAWRRVSCGR